MSEASKPIIFKKLSVNRESVKRALRVAMIVGIILNLINNPQLLSLSFTGLNSYKVILTFFVPFGVSLYSSILASRNKCPEKNLTPRRQGAKKKIKDKPFTI